MHFTVVSLFPEYFEGPLKCGLLAKAIEKGILDISLVNPRDFALDKHRSADDRPYGGGPGMVMSIEPLARAMQSVDQTGKILLLAPQGRCFDQSLAGELASEDNLTLVCGRYEGVDARFQQHFDAQPISIGDFVLNGGEAAALCVIEAVSRLLPQFMGKEESAEEESFTSGLLEYPHYTRPDNFQGHKVPEILLSGDHARVSAWRKQQALLATWKHRPDLLERAELKPADYIFLRSRVRNRSGLGRNLYVALLHYPVLNKKEQVSAVSLTNLDIHDIARVCRTYSLGMYYLVTPLLDQQDLAHRLLGHWQEGYGAVSNPDRLEAVRKVRVLGSFEEVYAQVERLCGQAPHVVATSAKDEGSMNYYQVRHRLKNEPVLLLLGTGSGIAPELLEKAHSVLRPIRCFDDYNHLSVRSAAAITVDRILKDFY